MRSALSRLWLLAARSIVAASVLTVPLVAQEKSSPTAPSAEQSEQPAKVAVLTLRSHLPEAPEALGLLETEPKNLKWFLDRLILAGRDKDVKAVALDLRAIDLPRGYAYQLREAVRRVQGSGKLVIGLLPPLATSSDYLALSACQHLVLPPNGWLLLTGTRAETWFFRDLLDWLGVQPQFVQAGAYKGAAEPFVRREMSPELRQQMESVVGDLHQQLLGAVGERLKCPVEKAQEIIDGGPYVAAEALQVGLVDSLQIPEELPQTLQKLVATPKVELVRDYGAPKKRAPSGLAGFMQLLQALSGETPRKPRTPGKPQIALIYAVGPIIDGRSTYDLFGGQMLGDQTLVEALQEADRDASVVAIVLRVDSPGGSATASDRVWREIRKLEKPIVVSMGSLAASGGYYISMGADYIVAEPTTLTGSIGAVGGKLAVRGLLQKVGIRPDVIQHGKNAGFLSLTDAWDEAGLKAMEKLVQQVYEEFLRKAAESRGLPVEEMQKMAQGKLWTGKQAAELRLVDRVGTLYDALDEAKKRAGLGADQEYDLLILPKPKPFFEQLLELTEVEAPALRALEEIQNRTLLVPEGLPLQPALQFYSLLQRYPGQPLFLLPFFVEIR
jgi:protease-4